MTDTAPATPTAPDDATLADVLRDGDAATIEAFLDCHAADETTRAVCELTDEEQATLLTTIGPAEAAEILDEIPDVEAVEAVALLPPEAAAAILAELPSDERADLLHDLAAGDAEALYAAMDPAEAERLRELAAYPDDSAGGLMATEVVAFPASQTVGKVIKRLRSDSDRLRRLDVQYAYVTDSSRRLVGVLRLRDLLLAEDGVELGALMIPNPLSVAATADFDALAALFEEHAFLGIPVVDGDGKLLGVVSRGAFDEAGRDRAASDFRRTQGLVEEEIRAMPTLRRSKLRLSWLSINILLNVVAASVIAGYQETLSQVIALAVFLPIISDMSGCSGNQAVAVSMRELALRLTGPTELVRVWLKEGAVGLINGGTLGLLLGAVAWGYAGNFWLGFVVGVALGLNTLVAVLIGGSLPLIMKRFGIDPALASGPILTTVTDMFGFFLVLSIATALLPWLV